MGNDSSDIPINDLSASTSSKSEVPSGDTNFPGMIPPIEQIDILAIKTDAVLNNTPENEAQTRSRKRQKKQSLIATAGVLHVLASFGICSIFLLTLLVCYLLNTWGLVVYIFAGLLLAINITFILTITSKQKYAWVTKASNIIILLLALYLFIFQGFNLEWLPICIAACLITSFILEIIAPSSFENAFWSIQNSVVTTVLMLSSFGWLVLFRTGVPLSILFYLFIMLAIISVPKILRIDNFLLATITFIFDGVIGFLLLAIIHPPLSIQHAGAILLLIFFIWLICDFIFSDIETGVKNIQVLSRSIAVGILVPLLSGLPIAILWLLVLYGKVGGGF